MTAPCRLARMAAGCCYECGEPAAPGRVKCAGCLADDRARVGRRYRADRVRRRVLAAVARAPARVAPSDRCGCGAVAGYAASDGRPLCFACQLADPAQAEDREATL